MNDNVVGGSILAIVVTAAIVATSTFVLFEDIEGFHANWDNHSSWSPISFVTKRTSTEGFTHYRVKYSSEENFDIGFVGPWPDNEIEWFTIEAGDSEAVMPIQAISAVWSFRISSEGHDHSKGNPDINIILYKVELVEIDGSEPEPDPIPEPEPNGSDIIWTESQMNEIENDLWKYFGMHNIRIEGDKLVYTFINPNEPHPNNGRTGLMDFNLNN